MGTHIAGLARESLGRDIVRHVFGQAIGGREIHSRRSAGAWMLNLDDSTLATFGHDRRAVEEVGRRPFPL